MKSREVLTLAAILALSLVLRCMALQTRSIQYDDAFSIFLAVRSIPEIIKGTAADTMPPLYYFLLHLWEQISFGLGWLRLLSVFLSLGCVVWIYLMVRSLFFPTAALWAAFLAGISPLQIYHAQDIRMYALLAFCQLGYGFFFIRIWQGKENLRGRTKIWIWMGLVIFGTLAMYTHNLAIFGLIVPNVWLLVRKEWKYLGRLLLAQACILIFFVPWLLFIPGQLEKIQHAFWTPRPGIVEVLQSIILLVATIPLPGMWLILAAIISIQVVALVALEFRKDKEYLEEKWLLACFVLIPPVLLFLASYLIRPVFVTRGFISSGLYFLGLAGATISLGWKRKTGVILLSFFIASGIISLPYQITFRQFPRSPYEAGLMYIRANIRAGDIILHDNKLSYFPGRFYAPDLPQTFLADEAGSFNDTYAIGSQEAMDIFPERDISSATQAARRIIFVVYTPTIEEYRRAGSVHPVLKWLSDHYEQTDRKLFNDLEVYYFSR